MEIDLNCDLGEQSGNDAALMPLITSANVACGYHAGNPVEMWRAFTLAKQHQVVIGAHPSHPDVEHFGRRELPLEPSQVYVDTVYQIGGLLSVANIEQMPLKYVKPHGGLYHQANREDKYADAIVEAARMFGLVVMGLPRSRLEERCRGRCPYVAEGFADRRYRPEGSLVPRDQPGAFIIDPQEAVAQVERLIKDDGIRTICVHGDNSQAVLFVQVLREALLRKGFQIRPFA
jgi:5-oxoprolinase (ATP-hydrolysing) subunit A